MIPIVVREALGQWLSDADHVDVKTAPSDRALHEVAARAVSYQPDWVTFLFRVRKPFVRLLGMQQEGIPRPLDFTADSLPKAPGEKVGFFTVVHSSPTAWMCEAEESHLWAALATVEDTTQAERVMHLVTIVRYKRWTGPVYFNVIRPFHHLVVRGMLQAGTTG